MAPPLARAFVLEHLAGFDDEALATFLAPGEGGVEPDRLGTALRGAEHDELAARVLGALPQGAAAVFEAARGSARAEGAAVASARRHVVERLFWVLLYWHMPDAYEELVAGEEIPSTLLDALRVEGREVADLGAGAGRFTLAAAARARRVVAIDAVPALLERLRGHCAEAGIVNVEVRRGRLDALPLGDAVVDLAVACSSLTSHAPFGGDAALREARRVVRPGGRVAVVWPDDPAFFCARGFTYLAVPGEMVMRFRDVAAARRLCRDFYSPRAEAWVTAHDSAIVPFEVLGVHPPRDACVLDVDGDPDRARRPQPGVVTPLSPSP